MGAAVALEARSRCGDTQNAWPFTAGVFGNSDRASMGVEPNVGVVWADLFPSSRGGVARHQEDFGEAHLSAADGVVACDELLARE